MIFFLLGACSMSVVEAEADEVRCRVVRTCTEYPHLFSEREARTKRRRRLVRSETPPTSTEYGGPPIPSNFHFLYSSPSTLVCSPTTVTTAVVMARSAAPIWRALDVHGISKRLVLRYEEMQSLWLLLSQKTTVSQHVREPYR